MQDTHFGGVAAVEPYYEGFAVSVSGTIDIRARISSTLVGAGWELLELRPLAMSLEEIFLTYYGEQS